MLLSHEPLLNRQRTITATRLVVHSLAGADALPLSVELNRLADVWPDGRTVLVAFKGAPLDISLLDWNVPANAMIELPADALTTAATAELLAGLQAKGVALCLSGYDGKTPLPPGADFRFILAPPHIRCAGVSGLLLATNPANTEEFEACLARGFAGASGWFFLRAQSKAKKLLPGHARIVHLINLVRSNADIRDIEAALKQDVALSFKLLRYINSAGFGLLCEIQSFKHAVTILGYEKLNKWLSLLLVTASKDPAAQGMMQTAIVRGRLMELAAASYFDKSELDNLFITGAFSLLDAILGTPMDAVLEEMRLPEPVTEALLNRSGVYAPFLALAKSCESSDGLELAQQVESLGIKPGLLNQTQLAALAFADSIQIT